MSSNTKTVKHIPVQIGQTATFPGTPVAAFASGGNGVEVYYEDTPAIEHAVSSFRNGERIPLSGIYLASVGTGANIAHVYGVPTA